MNEKVYDYMDWPRIEAVVYGEEASPRDVMGPKITQDGVLVQGFFPGAEEVSVVLDKKEYPCEMEDEDGYFASLLPVRKIPAYYFLVKKDGETKRQYDPYAFPVQITEEDEKAFCAGVSYQIYEKLGAHPAVIDGVEGTCFAVWAPNAIRVSVVGSFNNWDGRASLMHRMPMSGIFELFVPEAKAGDSYKYEVRIRGGQVILKADPYAASAELPPSSASVITDLSSFTWTDDAWMKERVRFADRKQAISIYETDLGLWKDTKELIGFVKGTGYTHVELHPVMEHMDDGQMGYSTSSYYAPTTRFGTPSDFQALINTLHQEGIGVILDWAPSQFPRYDGSLEMFDGTPLYERSDGSPALHPFKGTLLYNYASPMVKDFLIANACFWLEVYHADGLRMDDVDAILYLDYGRRNGEWYPNLYGTNENLEGIEFLKHLNSIIKKRNPGALMIAKEDGLWPELTESVEEDHIGFDYKWSGGWTRDFLSYLRIDPIERKHHHDQLTLSMLYAYCEHYILTLGAQDVGNSISDFAGHFPGDEQQKLSQVREACTYMMLHPGCKMMAADHSLSKEMTAFLKSLNDMYRTHPALYQMDNEWDGFEWIQLMKYEENVLAFLRKTEKPEETILAVCNFAAIPYEGYHVGVPFYGKYKEIFNSDDVKFGGEGLTNPRQKTSEKKECDERPYRLTINLPALGISVFTCTPTEEKKTTRTPAKKTTAKKTASAAKKTTTAKKTAAKAEPTAAKAAETVKTEPASKEVPKKETTKKEAAKKETSKKTTNAAAEKETKAAKTSAKTTTKKAAKTEDKK